MPGLWLAIISAILIFPLNTSVSITQQNLHSFLTSQVFFVASLDAKLPDVVARLIIFVLINVALRNLSHLSQHVSAVGILVLPDASFLHIEARKAKHLLTKHTEILVVYLCHEELLRKAGVSRILSRVLDIVHALDKIVFGDAQSLAEVKRVKVPFLLVHHHHDVVGRLVIDKQFAVTIAYNAPAGIFNSFEKGVRIGTLTVVVAHNLKREKAYDIHCHNEDGYSSNDDLSVFKIEILHSDETT